MLGPSKRKASQISIIEDAVVRRELDLQRSNFTTGSGAMGRSSILSQGQGSPLPGSRLQHQLQSNASLPLLCHSEAALKPFCHLLVKKLDECELRLKTLENDHQRVLAENQRLRQLLGEQERDVRLVSPAESSDTTQEPQTAEEPTHKKDSTEMAQDAVALLGLSSPKSTCSPLSSPLLTGNAESSMRNNPSSFGSLQSLGSASDAEMLAYLLNSPMMCSISSPQTAASSGISPRLSQPSSCAQAQRPPPPVAAPSFRRASTAESKRATNTLGHLATLAAV